MRLRARWRISLPLWFDPPGPHLRDNLQPPHGRRGRACAIYPAMRMVEIVSQMRTRRVEPKRLRMVHSRPGARGVFVLVEGVKGGAEELAVEPPLFIYGGGGGYSPEMAAVLRCLFVSPADGDERSPAS